MSDENEPYTKPIPDYIRTYLERAKAVIDSGGTVWWKWTCKGCGSRQTFEDANALHVTGTCGECGVVTDLLASASADVGFDALLTGGRKPPSV